jgi:hypothetical protein
MACGDSAYVNNDGGDSYENQYRKHALNVTVGEIQD